ncbi:MULTISPECIES: hypothetical protein [unclassified Lentimonas]|nr:MULTISPECIES: hypothetical protein [unclassified Lentimonas]CAA6678011.1 Unannotated [Lentimonas sp. CC4]CAA7077656.1 Unannotated [Lentimonas sp. CC4]CAA7168466.1 Unannotated [Lentimonas sp. CC21]CAA7182971.1 Unannotated [Lentimonas sp. CC8]
MFKLFALLSIILLSGCCTTTVNKALVLNEKSEPVEGATVKVVYYTLSMLPAEYTTDEEGKTEFKRNWCMRDDLSIWAEHEAYYPSTKREFETDGSTAMIHVTKIK